MIDWLRRAGLLDRRDLGSGLIQEREGRSHASAWLSSPEALALRLRTAGRPG